MRRICAWCKKELDPEPDGQEPREVTHGICAECQAFIEANSPTSLRQFLDRFSVPIVCMDADARVVTANAAACTLLGRSYDQVANYMCGDVIQCRWARLDGGCGRTEHCVGCTIRLLVEEVMESGASLKGRPAYYDRLQPDGSVERTELLLSTEKQGEVVLLRIDHPDRLPLCGDGDGPGTLCSAGQ